MDIHTAMEESYKRGYAKGYADATSSARKGRWITHTVGLNVWAECSECLTCGSPHWKVCPVCEARMEPMPLDDSFPDSKTINIKKPDVEVKRYG